MSRGMAARPAVSTAMETMISGQYAPIVVSRSCAASCGPRARPMRTAIETAAMSRIVTAMTNEKNTRLMTRRVTTAEVTPPVWALQVAWRDFRPRARDPKLDPYLPLQGVISGSFQGTPDHHVSSRPGQVVPRKGLDDADCTRVHGHAREYDAAIVRTHLTASECIGVHWCWGHGWGQLSSASLRRKTASSVDASAWVRA